MNKRDLKHRRYSPIAPVEVLLELRSMGLVDNYLLVLPHDVVRNPQGYRDLLAMPLPNEKEVGEWFIILDNGAAEIAKGEVHYQDHASMMVEAFSVVQPDVIALMDVIGDPLGSYNASAESREEWAALLFERIGVQAGLEYEWMAIPQGVTTERTLEMAMKMAHWNHVNFWGIPRNLANHCGTRISTVDRISSDIRLAKPMHLLGMSNFLYDDIEAAKYPYVMGIDSANPLVLGWQGSRIDKRNPEATPHVPRHIFWENRSINDVMCDNICVIQELLEHGNQLPK